MFLYNILGINRESSLLEIKNAYRNLAKKYHPDLNDDEGAEIIFKTIKIAYELLSNEYTRTKYDTSTNQINALTASDFLDNFEKNVKNVYLEDLSLSMEFNRKIMSNQNYFIATSISSLTINRGISPNDIESAIKKAYARYEKIATKSSTSETASETKLKHSSKQIRKDKQYLKKKNKLLWIAGILILFLSMAAYYYNPQIREELDKLNEIRQRNIKIEQQALERERLKQERISAAKLNPDLYWNFSFASPNNDDTFYLGYSVDLYNRTNKNMYCVVVGITANKETSSIYYLDDSYDNGTISLLLDDFKIGSTKPTNIIMNSCDYIRGSFPITTSNSFLMSKGETVYLLFEIYPKVTSDIEPLSYKNINITDLQFK